MSDVAQITPDGKAGEHLAEFRAYRSTRDRRLRNELVEAHRWIAHVAVRRFTRRGEPIEDLLQVALLGLVKAVERFDPDVGRSFPAFALPTISGELRRHFRDATWALHVTRRAKDLHLALGDVVEPLTQQLRRSPRLEELAAALSATVDEVLEAMEAGNAYRASPLPAPSRDEDSVRDLRAVAMDDPGLVSADTRIAVRELVAQLPERQRRVVYLRFFADLTQTEIAQRVGISQVHVSRLLQATLRALSVQLGVAASAASTRTGRRTRRPGGSPVAGSAVAAAGG